MSVGTSGRTKGKHYLMNKIIGREAAVIAGPKWKGERRYVVLDLTAGNGASSEQYGDSSAAIANKHRKFLAGRGIDCTVVLYEKDRISFQQLASQFGDDCLCIPADSSEPNAVSRSLWTNRTPVFVSNDPNNIGQFALSDQLINSLPDYTTTLSTLGCNPSGIKRASREVRDMWRAHVNRVAGIRSTWHTAILVALKNDDSQWAYLITGPRSWRTQYEKDARSAFKEWPGGVDIACIDDGPKQWDALLDRLFLTKTELALKAQPPLFGEEAV